MIIVPFKRSLNCVLH